MLLKIQENAPTNPEYAGGNTLDTYLLKLIIEPPIKKVFKYSVI